MANFRVDFLPSSRRDLMAIGSFIARDNLERALSFVDKIETFTRNQL